MNRWLSILFLFLVLGGLWGVMGWEPKPPAPPPLPPTKVLPWSEFFLNNVLSTLPVATDFVTPLNPPRGEGAFIARPFNSSGHLGEDWNLAVGNQDLGTPVVSPADGWVSLAIDFQSMWGKVILVIYRLPGGTKPAAVEMMFAHLSRLDVQPLTFVKKGQILGLMGNADDVYQAHLHWEVRSILGFGLGGGYSESTRGWIAPSQFLQSCHPNIVPYVQAKNLPESSWAAWGSD